MLRIALSPAPNGIKTGLGNARGGEVSRGRESRQEKPGLFATFTGETRCIALFFNVDRRRRKKVPLVRRRRFIHRRGKDRGIFPAKTATLLPPWVVFI